jgi:hypothetical protein
MTVTINGTTGISTPGLSSTADVTLAGAAVELLNNSGRIVVGQSGSVIQVATYATGAVATGTTIIPFDDTIPQITEGTEFMTLAITPSSATNTLIIQVTLVTSLSVANNSTVALFQDSTANALAAVASQPGITITTPQTFNYKMTAGTTSSTTFRVRAGGGAASTITINGFAGGRIFGGVMASTITIYEVAG